VEDQAAQLSAELNEALARLQDATASAQALTLFTVNNNIILHATGELFGMLHEVTGMPSVTSPSETVAAARPEPGSPEALAMAEQREARLQQAMAAEPEWLFVLDRGAATGGDGQGEQTLAEHPAVAASAAWQSGQVFYLDPPTWYVATGGYLGLMQTLEELQARFSN
jgi:iron complex transport system substrate-binding protein